MRGRGSGASSRRCTTSRCRRRRTASEYYLATWTGISGDRFYRNAPGADFTTFTDAWVNANIRSKGPLGKLYPVPVLHPRGRHAVVPRPDRQRPRERDEPDLRRLGRPLRLAAVLRRDRAPFWTQGGDSFPGRDNSRDTVVGVDGKTYTSDQATIWRWRTAFQHDFAARMDWTIKDVARGEPQPERRRERPGRARRRSTIDAVVGTPLTLDAAGTRDPDGNALTYSLVLLSRGRAPAFPGQPVRVRRPRAAPARTPDAGGIPPPPDGGPPRAAAARSRSRTRRAARDRRRRTSPASRTSSSPSRTRARRA